MIRDISGRRYEPRAHRRFPHDYFTEQLRRPGQRAGLSPADDAISVCPILRFVGFNWRAWTALEGRRSGPDPSGHHRILLLHGVILFPSGASADLQRRRQSAPSKR